MRVTYTAPRNSLKIFNPITWIQVCNAQQRRFKSYVPEMENESQRGEGHPLQLFHGCHCVTHSPMPCCSHSQLTVGCFLLARSILLIVRPKVIQSNEAPHLTKDTKAKGGISSATDSRHISKPFIVHVLPAKGSTGSPTDPCLPRHAAPELHAHRPQRRPACARHTSVRFHARKGTNA